jgi:hypothetical protein
MEGIQRNLCEDPQHKDLELWRSDGGFEVQINEYNKGSA